MDSSSALLTLTGVLVFMCLVVLASIRIVPERERVVLSRWGRTVRVAGPGLVLRVPLLDRWQGVSLLPFRVQSGVSAVSADGVPVHVQVHAVCRVVDPVLSPSAGPDLHIAVQGALESRVAREVMNAEAAELIGLRLTLEQAILAELEATTSEFGVQVDEIEINDFEVRLTMTLLESLRHGGRPEGRR